MSLVPNKDASPRPTNLAKEIQNAANQAVLSGVRTIYPGMVEEYDAATKRARVQIIIKQSFVDGTSKGRAPLIDVPMMQPSTGGYMIHIPIVEGDIVMVAFTQTGLETFKQAWDTGMDLVEPVPASYFTDAIALPFGMHNIEPVDDEGICLQSADGRTYFTLKEGQIEMRVGNRLFRMTEARGILR